MSKIKNKKQAMLQLADKMIVYDPLDRPINLDEVDQATKYADIVKMVQDMKSLPTFKIEMYQKELHNELKALIHEAKQDIVEEAEKQAEEA